MFDQSIAGIKLNLEAFSQAAARIAQPSTSMGAQDAGAPVETSNDPGTRSKAWQSVDQAQETVNMMVAQKGVEANLGVLKAALALSGQTIDILA